jgi:hypothetical protein
MSKDVMVDAASAVSIAVVAVRRAETYFDWEGNGPRHTGLKKLREQLVDIQCSDNRRDTPKLKQH